MLVRRTEVIDRLWLLLTAALCDVATTGIRVFMLICVVTIPEDCTGKRAT